MTAPVRPRPASSTRKARPSLQALLKSTVDEQVQQIRAGFPVAWLDQFLEETGLPQAETLAVLLLPLRTLARRRNTGRLSAVESDRLFRLARLFEQAVELFEGNREAAARWFAGPVHALGHVSPLEMSATEAGAHEVHLVIGRLEYGVYT